MDGALAREPTRLATNCRQAEYPDTRSSDRADNNLQARTPASRAARTTLPPDNISNRKAAAREYKSVPARNKAQADTAAAARCRRRSADSNARRRKYPHAPTSLPLVCGSNRSDTSRLRSYKRADRARDTRRFYQRTFRPHRWHTPGHGCRTSARRGNRGRRWCRKPQARRAESPAGTRRPADNTRADKARNRPRA